MPLGSHTQSYYTSLITLFQSIHTNTLTAILRAQNILLHFIPSFFTCCENEITEGSTPYIACKQSNEKIIKRKEITGEHGTYQNPDASQDRGDDIRLLLMSSQIYSPRIDSHLNKITKEKGKQRNRWKKSAKDFRKNPKILKDKNKTEKSP